MLAVDLHRYTMTEDVRLQLRAPAQPTVHLAQPPDVLPCHRTSYLAFTRPTPARPEQRCVRCHRSVLHLDHVLDVAVEELHHHRGQGDIPRLAALHRHAS